jgi:hypothetical protein
MVVFFLARELSEKLPISMRKPFYIILTLKKIFFLKSAIVKNFTTILCNRHKHIYYYYNHKIFFFIHLLTKKYLHC